MSDLFEKHIIGIPIRWLSLVCLGVKNMDQLTGQEFVTLLIVRLQLL